MGKRKVRKKDTYNLSGLHNQHPQSTSNNLNVPDILIHKPVTELDKELEDSDSDWQPHTLFDSLKPDLPAEEESDNEEEEVEWDSEWKENERLGSNGLQAAMIKLAIALGDDPRDEEWIPPRLRAKRERAKKERRERPTEYIKGPDVGSKSERSQRRYKSLLKNQSCLNTYFSIQSNKVKDPGNAPVIREESQTPPPLSFEESNHDSNVIASHPQSESTVPAKRRHEEVEAEAQDGVDEDHEPWEEELGEAEAEARMAVRGWKELRDQIKNDLKKKHHTLSLKQHNQLTILRNFATLILKGYCWIPASLEIANQWHEAVEPSPHFARRIRALARHYQVFEQLPKERRGGSRHARSLLNDETVKAAARTWLTAQKIGTVTPNLFTKGLNESILPSLNITVKKPLCVRTARRWLVKLGWTLKTLQKGVYMDGHERTDVVEYRETVYLPSLAKDEPRMVKFEFDGSNLCRIEPELQPGERLLIPIWQDESCFQANDYKKSAWLQTDEQILMKKGRGRLIHVSEFINEHDGRLVVRDSDGNILQEARKIIFPGSNGDAWWDCEQLIKQVKEQAIPVFDAAHPGCQALFIFDQSSAHASLPPDSLKAFEMNKSNGGKQRKQKHTVIPMNNPDITLRGKVQLMTTEDGKAKGLEQTLRERGFNVSGMRAKCSPVCPWENENCCMARLLSKQDDFVNQTSMLETVITEAGHKCLFLPKFHCELNPIEMYWGWAKYRYREVTKKTFDDAKKAALNALNECSTDTIRRFTNRSWRFHSAYRFGLKGKAAAWAVKEQKGHRSCSETAMRHLEAILT